MIRKTNRSGIILAMWYLFSKMDCFEATILTLIILGKYHSSVFWNARAVPQERKRTFSEPAKQTGISRLRSLHAIRFLLEGS
jgi:hypothetical protein